jgi:hypothetical protein
MAKKSGKCLCGGVTVTIEAAEPQFDVCHCGMCRRWGGGPAVVVQASTGIALEGQELVTTYASSEWAERGFCKRCGTHLFYRLKDGSYSNVTHGILDGTEGFKFNSQIFIDRKPAGYAFANETKTMTEAEVMALFGSQG